MKIPYEALDGEGRPYIREARVINELPTPADRLATLPKATEAISKILGIPATETIGFGTFAWRAFMFKNERDLRNSPSSQHADLLTKRGCDLPLSLV